MIEKASPEKKERESSNNSRKPFNMFGSKKEKKSVTDPFGIKKNSNSGSNFNSLEDKGLSRVRDEAPVNKPGGIGLSLNLKSDPSDPRLQGKDPSASDNYENEEFEVVDSIANLGFRMGDKP